MNPRDLQPSLRERPEIAAEIAALEHLEVAVERHTTLPTSELRKEIDVLRIEEKLAANVDDALRLIIGAERAAKLLGGEGLRDLGEAKVHLLDVQAGMARRRGER